MAFGSSGSGLAGTARKDHRLAASFQESGELEGRGSGTATMESESSRKQFGELAVNRGPTLSRTVAKLRTGNPVPPSAIDTVYSLTRARVVSPTRANHSPRHLLDSMFPQIQSLFINPSKPRQTLTNG